MGAKSLSGLSCGDPNNWNDRLLPNITSDTTIQHCLEVVKQMEVPSGIVVAPCYESFNIGQLPIAGLKALLAVIVGVLLVHCL